MNLLGCCECEAHTGCPCQRAFDCGREKRLASPPGKCRKTFLRVRLLRRLLRRNLPRHQLVEPRFGVLATDRAHRQRAGSILPFRSRIFFIRRKQRLDNNFPRHLPRLKENRWHSVEPGDRHVCSLASPRLLDLDKAPNAKFPRPTFLGVNGVWKWSARVVTRGRSIAKKNIEKFNEIDIK